jgi:hypothetical protein
MFRSILVAALIAGAAAIGAAPLASATPPARCSDTPRQDIPAGDPDYGPWLDRDHDGIACES